MKGIDDRTVSIVASMDEEKYISNFASADFTIADGSLKNYSLSESSTDSVSFEDMKKFNSISGVEESGAICMSESMQNMKGTPYERLVKLYETHPEWFTHGTSEKKYFAPIVYGEKSINSHIYGVDRIVYEKMNMDTKAVDWETFSSGNYAIVSAPVESDRDDSQYAGALQYFINIKDENMETAEEFILDYCENVNPKLGYTSRKTYLKEFQETIHTFLIIGGALSAILALIGILNLINLTYTSIHERKQELKVLGAVGMTKRQISSMLSYEGIFRVLLTFGLVFTLGQLLNYVVVQLVAGQMVMFSYCHVVWPMLACVPIFMMIAVIVPCSYTSVCEKRKQNCLIKHFHRRKRRGYRDR